MSILQKILGDPNAKVIKKLRVRVEEISDLESRYEKLSSEEIRKEISKYRESGNKTPEYLDNILPNVFAMVREAAKRTLGQRHYDVQLMGGMALHAGNVTEMRTGEGKTLVATLPAALNAIAGMGVHIVTVNDYLAQRDAVWMGQIFHALGLSVGCINHDTSFLYDPTHKEAEALEDKERDALGGYKVFHEFLRPCTRPEAYRADITYGTNNEYGFDWLRDNLVIQKEDLRQHDHFFAIVDEVDSILIDEARTPLIISSPDEEAANLYGTFAQLVPRLKKEEHYTVDEKMKAVQLTEDGITQVESLLGIQDIYTEKGIRYVHHLEQALKAHVLFQKDRHYVVKNGAVTIVDEFTGRLMPGRRWSDGLHQAIEAKENVSIQQESRTLATVTFQNYFRMYEKLSGMTGTATTSAEEFHKVYGLEVVVVPTNKPMIRRDMSDKIFQTESGKYKAVVREIKERNEKGQPVLVGTISIEKNELLSEMLKREGVEHRLLNAKKHEEEAEIIAQAGRKGRVTIATNIAGRGVDIILGGNPPDADETKKVLGAGGLFVLGTERHEARRIDNQLRGRAGRQGDPGASQFFVSMEDDLMRIFAPTKIKSLMGTFGIPEDEPIESRMVSRAIESAQSKIEGFHFDARKHLLEYDDVLSKQRNFIYKMRREMLSADEQQIKKKMEEVISNFVSNVINAHTGEGVKRDGIAEALKPLIGSDDIKRRLDESGYTEESVLEFLTEEYSKRLAEGGAQFIQSARVLFLQLIDMLWRDHLEVMEHMRSSVGLRAYGQRDPLVEYKNEAHKLFKTFNANLASLFVQNLFRTGDNIQMRSGHEKMVTNETRAVAQKILRRAGEAKVGRNDPCPCGSGKKYKKCGLINAPYHKK